MNSQTKESHPMGMHEFNQELQKESPDFYEKFQGTKFEKDVFKSEQHFLNELKKHAPNLYHKLEAANFKFKLDEETKKHFADLVKQSEETLKQLKDQ